MGRKITVLQGSPKSDGNTAALCQWVSKGARDAGANVDIVETARLKYKAYGCLSCMGCQRSDKYLCVVNDDAQPILAGLPDSDVIVLATPLYFFGPSAQLKLMVDRMYSLYKFDRKKGEYQTPLKGKTLALVASAGGEFTSGMNILEQMYQAMARFSGMSFRSLLGPLAGLSGDIKGNRSWRDEAVVFGGRLETVV